MTALVIAEHTNAELAAATLSVVAAASQLDSEIHVLVAGSGCDGAADAARKIPGVSKVLVADAPSFDHMLAENVAQAVVDIADGYDVICAADSTNGKNVTPRVAALLDVAQISDVMSIEGPDTFKRPIYAGNIIATVQTSDAKKVLTVRTTSFDGVEAEGGSATVEKLDAAHEAGLSSFVGESLTESERPDLGAAKVVVSGGRGVGSGENFKVIEDLADALGAAVGASRAAVDAGYVPNDYQVGQTGKIVAPQLYVAVGISGAIQHLAGMKDSKVIVAINKDEEAPIFGVADYGLVADLFDAVPKLAQLVRDAG